MANPNEPSKQQQRGPDRRKNVVDARINGLERRRGPGRRLSDFAKAAEEGEMTTEQFLFIQAINAFKKANDKPFPTWTEVLEVMRKVGYRKTCKMAIDLPQCEDWTEPGDAPAFPPSASEASDERDAA
ncbi:MAG: hypothetical protein ACPGYV_04050 [Phycisphaeraceae bacterium]